MFFKKCCCCLKTTNKTDSIPTNETSCGGVNNKSFETWEPVEQQNVSDRQPKLSKSSRSSFESIKLSKIDLNLNIFENDRFSDMSATIHKIMHQALDENDVSCTS